MITISQLQRIALCPGSATLPQIRETNPEARYGSAAHKLIERRLLEEPVDVAGLVRHYSLDDYHASALAALDRCAVLPRQPAFAVEWARGLWLDRPEGDRVSAASGGEGRYRDEGQDISGTVDVIYLEGDALTALVVDWKTGAADSVPHPDRNWQLRGAALMVAVAHPKMGVVRPALCHFTAAGALDHDARGEPYAGEWVYGAPLNAADLDTIESELRALLARARAPEPQLIRGNHCTACPSRAACPALAAELRALSPMSGELVTVEEQAARAVEVLPALRRYLDDVERGARAIADANGGRLVLSDGREYVRETYYPATYDPEVTRVVLAELLDSEERALAAIDVSTSRAAIERAVGGSAKTKLALRMIGERGGVTRAPKTRWERKKKVE